MRKILTNNTQLILGNSNILEKLKFSLEDNMFLVSLSTNIPIPNMVMLTSVHFGKHQYINGLDDAMFYYPLFEYAGTTKKREECRNLGMMKVNSSTLATIELQYTGAIPIGYYAGMMFNFIASLETEVHESLLDPNTNSTMKCNVAWSEEDQEFVGTCDKFPSLSYLDKNKDNALKGIINLITECQKDIQIETDKDTSPIFTTPQRKCGVCGRTHSFF